MNFKDMDIKQQIEIAEKQISDLRQHMMEYCKENNIDPNVSMAGILALLAQSIAMQAGRDSAKQDACVAFILKALYVSLAENGYRDHDEHTQDSILPWEKN